MHKKSIWKIKIHFWKVSSKINFLSKQVIYSKTSNPHFLDAKIQDESYRYVYSFIYKNKNSSKNNFEVFGKLFLEA